MIAIILLWSYLQVVSRILRDFANSTAETSSSLHQTKSYLTSHIGTLTEKSILVMHHLVRGF